MIAAPINDTACLEQINALAREAMQHPDIRALAARFRTTAELVRWIRLLPQRDDDGDPSDGPRITCDVSQRARVLPDNPNCFERSLILLAAGELIDPRPVRQLATVTISEHVRHTFVVENGEPVVLDPKVRRNALRAGLWRTRNGDAAEEDAPTEEGPIDGEALLTWLVDLAEDAATELGDDRGARRVAHARRMLAHLLQGGVILPRDRADVLYVLRLAGDVAPTFGSAGRDGFRLARGVVAQLVTHQTRGAARRNVSVERVVYWSGKGLATYAGVGGLYDSAYNEVRQRIDAPPKPPSVTPSPPPPAPRSGARPAQAAPGPPIVVGQVRMRESLHAPSSALTTEETARLAIGLGALVEIAPKKGNDT